jgi:hypothetical protein
MGGRCLHVANTDRNFVSIARTRYVENFQGNEMRHIRGTKRAEVPTGPVRPCQAAIAARQWRGLKRCACSAVCPAVALLSAPTRHDTTRPRVMLTAAAKLSSRQLGSWELRRLLSDTVSAGSWFPGIRPVHRGEIPVRLTA